MWGRTRKLNHAAQTIAQLTKWPGETTNPPPVFTDSKRNGGPRWQPETTTPISPTRNGTAARPAAGRLFVSQVPENGKCEMGNGKRCKEGKWKW